MAEYLSILTANEETGGYYVIPARIEKCTRVAIDQLHRIASRFTFHFMRSGARTEYDIRDYIKHPLDRTDGTGTT